MAHKVKITCMQDRHSTCACGCTSVAKGIILSLGYHPISTWCLHLALVSFMTVVSVLTCGELVIGLHSM